MKLNKKLLSVLAEKVNSPSRKANRNLLWKIYTAYHGGLFGLLQEAIRNEFQNPDAIKELEARLVPINILKKVSNKIGGIYNESPVRMPVDENTDDAELLEDYEDITKFNIRQKQSNRYLELFKKNLKEIFAQSGKVFIRNLPPYSYEVFNLGNPDKSLPDVVCKIIVDADDLKEQILHFWSDESFFITDGEGTPRSDMMNEMSNPNGKNPSRVLPFVYKCKSTDSVDPIVDDALYRISIAIPIVLTDLFFACKYQCWSMIYTIGVSGTINRNPSSIIALNRTEGDDRDPVIDQINPTVDSDKVIAMLESTLTMFLSSVGLSSGTISLGTNAKDALSGVSKALDSAEVIEGKKDMQEDMLDDENMTFDVIVRSIPYWRRNQMLGDDINREFSQGFRVSTSFKEPRAMLSEKDSMDLSAQKIAQKMSTWTRELKSMYPDYNADQIEQLKQDIKEEMELHPEIYQSPMAITIGGGNKLDNPNDLLKKKTKDKKDVIQS